MSRDITRAAFLRHWDSLPILSLGGQCDPFRVDDRLALYKTMMVQTGRADITGADNAGHIFWGHGFQLFWQSRSGRLGVASECIDPAAWWGAVNFSLSLIPYLGAVQAGCAKALVFTSPKNGKGGIFDLDHGPAPCWATMIAAWADWFSYLANEADADDLDALRLRAWGAHLVCIDGASQLFQRQYDAMPALERDFALGWTRMVDFFGAAARPTDFDALKGIDERPLAPCVLENEGTLAAMDGRSLAGSRAVIALGRMADHKFSRQSAFWRRAMRRRAMRNQSAKILAAMFSPPLPVALRLKLMWEAGRP